MEFRKACLLSPIFSSYDNFKPHHNNLISIGDQKITLNLANIKRKPSVFRPSKRVLKSPIREYTEKSKSISNKKP